MNLPTIMLMPSVNTSYPCPGGTYTSDTRGYVFNALVSDIPTLTGTFGAVTIAPRNNTATTNPTTANDFTQLYGPGSLWENSATAALFMCTAMGSSPGTATWTAIAASSGTLIGSGSAITVTPTGASNSQTLADLFAQQYNNVKTFGAVGNGSTNDTTAVQAAWTAALSNGAPVYFPPGHYIVTGLNFDVTSAHTQIPLIMGAGSNRSIIDAGTSSAPTLYWHATAGNDGFFGGIMNLGFNGNWAGPVLKLCDDTFANGAINASIFTNLNVKNSSASASGIAVKVNYLLNSVFSNLIANTGGIGTGIALQLNQSAFNVFAGCSFSSSQTGVHITNGFNFSNRFDAPDIEVVNHCVLQDSVNGNGHNKFIGGQFVWPATTFYAIVSSSPVGMKLIFDNVNFAPSSGSGDLFIGKVLDPSNQAGVQIFGDYGDGTTPAGGTPSTGTTYTNTTGQAQMVTLYSGRTFTVQINPASSGPTATVGGADSGGDNYGGSLAFTLRPSYSIKVTSASSTVNWLWFPVPG